MAPPVDGGYGQGPYGIDSYGNTQEPVSILSATSLDGYHIEVAFAGTVPISGSLLDPSTWVLTPTLGANTSVVLVAEGTLAPGGVTSVVLTHVGTTLGGTYVVSYSGTLLSGSATLLTLGDPPAVTVTAPAGNRILLSFNHELLAQAPSGDTPSNPTLYEFSSNPVYPVDLSVLSSEFPYLGDASKVLLSTQGMTSVTYDTVIVPSLAIEYDGSYRPNEGTTFQGVSLGTGTSTIVSGSLRLGRAAGNTYGWRWADLTGRLDLDTTFRVDLAIDASGASMAPLPSGLPIATLYLDDADRGLGVGIQVTLQRSALGVDQVRLQSGAYDTTFDVSWSIGPTTISLIRNMKAGFYTLLVGGAIVTSALLANFTGTSTASPSVTFLLENGAFSIANFQVSHLLVSASHTLFSSAWNFIHELTTSVPGNPEHTRASFLTKRGPLVKNWGDATPATKADVAVRVNGVPVSVAAVNPYIGQITLDVPIPMLPLGDPQADVEVDYVWFQSPVMEMAGLDTPGLVFDQYVIPQGHHWPASLSAQASQIGAADTNRFPFSVVLEGYERHKPLYIGHRYLGFEREYSALLDSPTTLLLDQAPGKAALPGFERIVQGTAVAYEATSAPSLTWTQTGTDFGQVNVGMGTYTLIDAKTGSYNPTEAQSTFYSQEFEVFPRTSSLVGRLQSFEGALFSGAAPVGADTPTATYNGVFSGISFGCHDSQTLSLLGLLKINGVYHVGLLLNPEEPNLAASWRVVPWAVASAASQTTVTMPTANVPLGFAPGMRFQVLDGLQAGVYTATSVMAQATTGVTAVSFTPALPTKWDTYGAKYFDAAFEVRHTLDFFTYRLEITSVGTTVNVSGEISGQAMNLTGLPAPARASLLVPMAGQGHVFWGSLDDRAASKAVWSFFRYSLVPEERLISSGFLAVSAEMVALPEDGTNPWFLTNNFGTATLSSGSLLLKGTSESSLNDFSLGYGRLEAFLTPEALFDYRSTFRVDSGVLGAGDIWFEINDGQRLVRLVNVLYREGYPDNITYRQLIKMPVVSVAGILSPLDQGWAASGAPLGRPQNAYFTTTQAAGAAGGLYTKSLDLTGLNYSDPGSRLAEARFRVDSCTPHTDLYAPVQFWLDVPTGVPGGMMAGVLLQTPGSVVLASSAGVHGTYAFDWNDGEFHTYRVVADMPGGTVALLIDDAIQLPTTNLAGYGAGTGTDSVFFGGGSLSGHPGNPAAVVTWASVSYQGLPPADAKRCLGIWTGGDVDDINSYELPRSDNSSAPNSWQFGPTVPGMDSGPVIGDPLRPASDWDWQSDMEIRLYRDPEWGVTLFMPTLPAPPFYQAEGGGAGTGYWTESVEPSLGWVNVEYDRLPLASKPFGYVRFGALDPRTVSQQRYDWVRYRMFRSPKDNRTAPHHMVLDQFNVIRSGELGQDVTLESVAIETIDLTRLSLLPTHIYASRIYKIVDGANIFTEEMWSFNPDTQLLTLQRDDEHGLDRNFSSQHATVVVVFDPGHVVTNTYLEGQPLLDGVTNLNEGTPPVPKSQIGRAVLGEEFNATLAPFAKSRWTNPAGTYYDDLEFIEVTDEGETGLITTICEGMLPVRTNPWDSTLGEKVYAPTGGGPSLGGVGDCAGLNETGTVAGEPTGSSVFAFKGTQFWQPMPSLNPGYDQRGGQPEAYLFASGGHFVGPVLDPLTGIGLTLDNPLGGLVGPAVNAAVLYPTQGGGTLGQRSALVQTEWRMDSFYEERLSPLNGLGDAVPPFKPQAYDLNPDGAPIATGAALMVFRYTLAAFVGPWGGPVGLTPEPDMGLYGPNAPVPGTALGLWHSVTGLLAAFTAVLGAPAAPGDWSLDVGSPLINLETAINTHPVASTVVLAEAGIDDLGVPLVLVRPLVPLAMPLFYYLTTSNVAETHCGVVLTVG